MDVLPTPPNSHRSIAKEHSQDCPDQPSNTEIKYQLKPSPLSVPVVPEMIPYSRPACYLDCQMSENEKPICEDCDRFEEEVQRGYDTAHFVYERMVDYPDPSRPACYWTCMEKEVRKRKSKPSPLCTPCVEYIDRRRMEARNKELDRMATIERHRFEPSCYIQCMRKTNKQGFDAACNRCRACFSRNIHRQKTGIVYECDDWEGEYDKTKMEEIMKNEKKDEEHLAMKHEEERRLMEKRQREEREKLESIHFAQKYAQIGSQFASMEGPPEAVVHHLERQIFNLLIREEFQPKPVAQPPLPCVTCSLLSRERAAYTLCGHQVCLSCAQEYDAERPFERPFGIGDLRLPRCQVCNVCTAYIRLPDIDV